MSGPAIQAREVILRRGGKSILNGASLQVTEGEVVGIIGPNGSGKSSLLKVLAAVLRPDGGRIEFLNRPLAAWDRLSLARTVSYMPQQFHCHWNLRVADLLKLGASRGEGFGGWPLPAHKSRAELGWLYDRFELAGFEDRLFNTLSGGEQARVRFASAIASKPRILLADEPTASLDVTHQLALMRLIRRLAEELSVLVVLHDLNLAARFVDRLILIDQGVTVLQGPAHEVIHSNQLDEIFKVKFQRMQLRDRLLIVPE